MFTGIVDHCGTITRLEQNKDSMSVWIRCQFQDLQIGESIAVDGICLTACDPQTHLFRCDISPETYRLTSARNFQEGYRVNLERALRLSDRVGGHVVTGHVDEQVEIISITPYEEFVEMHFAKLSSAAKPYLIKKGSIAVNGVSLTINEVYADGFKVMLIPHTLEHTNLSTRQVGDNVNIEFDWMARLVVNHFENHYRTYCEKNL